MPLRHHGLLVVTLLAGCKDGVAPAGPDATFTAINGASHAAVGAGDLIALEGLGFGAAQGESRVLVTAATGLVEAPPLLWRDNQIQARLPASAHSGPVVVERGAEQLGPVSLLVRSQDAFQPDNRPWTQAAQLPRRLWGAAAAALRYPTDSSLATVVVLFAGVDAQGRVTDSTYLGTVDANGVLTGWTAAPDTIVPRPRYLHAMTGADQTNSRLDIEGVAYTLGGRDTAGRVLAEVQGISVSASSAYGLWSSLTPLPGGRAGAAATTSFGSIIVVGGFGSDSIATPDVFVATIRVDGTINGWFRGPPLPEGRAFASIVAYRERLFVLGGETGAITPDSTDPASPNMRSTIYSIPLSARTGFFADSGWTEHTVSLARPRARHAAFVVDSALVVVGGTVPDTAVAAESEFAYVRLDGSLTAFADSPQVPIANAGGGPLHLPASPQVWTSRGAARVTLVGGRHANGEVSHSVWWH